jgi:hypothetical protein
MQNLKLNLTRTAATTLAALLIATQSPAVAGETTWVFPGSFKPGDKFLGAAEPASGDPSLAFNVRNFETLADRGISGSRDQAWMELPVGGQFQPGDKISIKIAYEKYRKDHNVIIRLRPPGGGLVEAFVAVSGNGKAEFEETVDRENPDLRQTHPLAAASPKWGPTELAVVIDTAAGKVDLTLDGKTSSAPTKLLAANAPESVIGDFADLRLFFGSFNDPSPEGQRAVLKSVAFAVTR